MKWITCNLLLILPAICIHCWQPANNSITTKNLNKDTLKIDQSIIILGTDGFIGKMQKDYSSVCSWGSGNSNCNPNCLTTTAHKKPMFVVSFKINSSCTSDASVYHHTGVSLSKDPLYQLSVNREDAPALICLTEGSNWSEDVFNRTGNTTYHVCNCINKKTFTEFNKTNITCLDPQKKCAHAQYKKENCTINGNTNIIIISHSNATCYKCGNATHTVPKVDAPIEKIQAFNKTAIDAGTAAAAMKNLSDMVSLLGNLTTASVSMGNVQGVLSKLNNKTDTTTAFIYSPESGFRILGDIDELKKYPNAFTIPKEVTQKALNQSKGDAFLGVFRFPNMTKDENNSEVLNNEVYAIEMGTEISNLTDCIKLNFNYKKDEATPICNSWNGSGNRPTWTTDGCNTTVDGNIVTCTCCHLTFFAVLMNPVDSPISNQDLVTLSYITYIGCGLSMFFLGIGLFMHFLLRKAKASNSVHVLINLFVALFLLNLAFLSNENVAHMKNKTACRIMAGFMHYFMLASFTWFAVEAFHLCLQMAKQTKSIHHYIIKISVVGWVPPALIVTIMNITNNYGELTIPTDTSNNGTMCWIVNSAVHTGVNVGYYCFVFIFTFSTFVVVLRWLWMSNRWKKMEKMKGKETGRSDITTIMGLCCLLGLTWSFSFFSYGALRVPSYYIFTILNSFQGFFLFIYYIKTSTLFGDAVPSDSSDITEETNSQNPYDN